MTRPTLALELPVDHLHIVRWEDPVLDAIGHDPRSAYVEQFWLSLLGPSTTFLIRRLAAGLEERPDGFDLDLEQTAKAIGLGLRGGRSGPFFRALARTGQFHITKAAGAGELAARTRLQTLTRHQVERLPEHLQAEHHAWVASAQATPTEEQRRTRARRLALSLLELGEPPEAAELQLHRWKIHPALAHQALHWAQTRRTGTPPPRPAASYGPADDAA